MTTKDQLIGTYCGVNDAFAVLRQTKDVQPNVSLDLMRFVLSRAINAVFSADSAAGYTVSELDLQYLDGDLTSSSGK